MSNRTDHSYEDYILDGKSMAHTLALSFGVVFLVVLVIGAVRDVTALVVMGLLYWGVAAPIILTWQQLLPWLRRRTREHWKRADPLVFVTIDKQAWIAACSDHWLTIANRYAADMLEQMGPLGPRYAVYTLAAFRDARTKWESTEAAS